MKFDLPFWIHAHIGCHAGNEVVVCGSQRRHRHCLSFEVANGVYALRSEQLEAARMHSTQQRDRCLRIQFDDVVGNEAHADVDLVAPHRPVDGVQWNVDILDVTEALELEQLLGYILRRNTNPGNFCKADGRYFRRSLLSGHLFAADQGCGCRPTKARPARGVDLVRSA